MPSWGQRDPAHGKFGVLQGTCQNKAPHVPHGVVWTCISGHSSRCIIVCEGNWNQAQIHRAHSQHEYMSYIIGIYYLKLSYLKFTQIWEWILIQKFQILFSGCPISFHVTWLMLAYEVDLKLWALHISVGFQAFRLKNPLTPLPGKTLISCNLIPSEKNQIAQCIISYDFVF